MTRIFVNDRPIASSGNARASQFLYVLGEVIVDRLRAGQASGVRITTDGSFYSLTQIPATALVTVEYEHRDAQFTGEMIELRGVMEESLMNTGEVTLNLAAGRAG